MNAAEITILLRDKELERQRTSDRRQTVSDTAETARGQAAEPGQSMSDRRTLRLKQIQCLGLVQRLDNELWRLDSEIRALKRRRADLEASADRAADQDEFFNRVRQVVSISNVVALPFHSNTPEAA